MTDGPMHDADGFDQLPRVGDRESGGRGGRRTRGGRRGGCGCWLWALAILLVVPILVWLAWRFARWVWRVTKVSEEDTRSVRRWKMGARVALVVLYAAIAIWVIVVVATAPDPVPPSALPTPTPGPSSGRATGTDCSQYAYDRDQWGDYPKASPRPARPSFSRPVRARCTVASGSPRVSASSPASMNGNRARASRIRSREKAIPPAYQPVAAAVSKQLSVTLPGKPSCQSEWHSSAASGYSWTPSVRSCRPDVEGFIHYKRAILRVFRVHAMLISSMLPEDKQRDRVVGRIPV